MFYLQGIRVFAGDEELEDWGCTADIAVRKCPVDQLVQLGQNDYVHARALRSYDTNER